MAALAQKKPLAVDSNFLFDLAAKKDFALTLRDLAKERGYSLHVPPTVVQELAYSAAFHHGEEQRLAVTALQNLRTWEITPFDLVAVGHGITEQFARRLHQLNLLPAEEQNDGLIVAETALAGIPVLLPSDHHLNDIDEAELCRVCRERDLAEVRVVHPRKLLRAWRK